MPRHSEDRREAVSGLLGLSSQSVRKSHYPELLARLGDLEIERNRYKWLFENAVHGIFRASLEHGLLAANPALARMLGYEDPEALLGLPTAVTHYMLVGGMREVRHIREVLQGQPGLYGYETRMRRRDGAIIHVIMNLLLKPDEPGLFEGFVADVSERKRAQLHLLQLNDELEQRVETRTRELLATNNHLQQEIAERERMEHQLREARDAAEEANRSKDKFLAAASHDLLQPLNAARLMVSTLLERRLPAAEQRLVERAHQALDGAEELLADLLDISRLDQAAVRPDLDNYGLEELLAPLASEFQPVAEAAGLRLRARFPELAVRTDAHLLNRVLRNLLSNACRYTQTGGVLLAARRRGERVRLEVRDTGQGIPAEQIGSIFKEFSQLEQARGARHKGVGLGLAIVERIAGILGYRIEVRSWPGRGSVFALEVPLAQDVGSRLPPGKPLTVQPSLGDPLPGCRLLVIDNEQSILDSMAALLGQWGSDVLLARDLDEARRVLAGRPPAAILADWQLDHGETGYAVIQSLRRELACPIPAVIITADRGEACLREMQAQGIPLLNKPLKPGKLRAVLSQLLK